MADRYAQVHEHPNGPGDSRPTAIQIIQDEDLVGKLSGKVAFITGCSSGIGMETAKALHLAGMTLYLTARNLAKAKTALGDLIDSDRVHLLELDLDSLASVRSCAAEFLSKSQTLNILICNAGVMTPPEGRTKDGFETQFGTNHLAHFLLFNLVQPALLAGTTPSFASRVVVLSSVAHRFGEVNFEDVNFDGGYDAMAAYAASKTANLWTANEIERRYGSQGVHAWSVQPGAVLTNLVRHMSDEQKGALDGDAYLASIYKNPDQGAATSVWGATAKALEGKGGRYLEDCQIAKEWDPSSGLYTPGYGAHAYDEEKAGKLWAESLKWVGL
ncbi:uncharacterized protein NECHADRAFT_75545 [Fusarium vanettenii 77-13-4]|uniref:Oxidoreductase n=1 Tax=Fusarium vanettenii (strain ATCC MYA-4622 / CBS 123669 / FGSC 9596 / NRRL 45880 / 77-13-4) TaxID=660122 RepID=C7YJ40_FUSV7|nr:uncharacterized protein NECHADRAFT_75545 [Fusarium vanettenii 77-13-4]EEU48202.1 hypothetical protein NECHADRAFT_75545 [Fusarium vanettenii 77-13-4]